MDRISNAKNTNIKWRNERKIKKTYKMSFFIENVFHNKFTSIRHLSKQIVSLNLSIFVNKTISLIEIYWFFGFSKTQIHFTWSHIFSFIRFFSENRICVRCVFDFLLLEFGLMYTCKCEPTPIPETKQNKIY